MKVLLQCGDHFENQSRVFLLAKELKQLGVEPVILMYKEKQGNLFLSNSIKVVYLSSYLSKVKSLKQDIDFSTKIYNDLKIIDFINIEVKRRPRIGWPSQVKKTSQQVYKYIIAINNILGDINPDHIVVWNGFTGYVANILRVLASEKNIDSSFIERGLLKDSIFIDVKGVNGNSTLTDLSDYPPANLKLAEYVDKLFIQKAISNTSDKSLLPENIKGKRVIFFPLQVQLDTNIIMYCKYNTMREVFFEIYSHLNNDDVIFVVRPHPEEDVETLSNLPNWDNLIVSTDLDLNFWLENSDLIVTINSTVGLEALLKGKPVICLGKSIYSSLPCLSKYNHILDDRGKILCNVSGYLGYLLTHNLIVKDSIYNTNVIKSIFKFNDKLGESNFIIDTLSKKDIILS
ncbi:hypothetical protein [Actinobacillus pleuropneumoniae]|uniref:capsular polysaccharide export protein, LipB/KpsS family n=1 Tax=Actinobacillus pleuropneumoniae TaxID=715 RepID=UPI001F335460|nr:hypothetical protein [Actinobacillus pleuropneumoniae]UKH33436.1 hypothetical protein D1103_08510 [Actinobacillus pleuropneumoniae serovar 10 str. D13039]